MYLAHHLVPPQVFVAQTSPDPKHGHYLTVQEADGNIRVCLQTIGIVREALYIHVETTHTNSSDYPPATGKALVLVAGNVYVLKRKHVCVVCCVLIYVFPHIS